MFRRWGRRDALFVAQRLSEVSAAASLAELHLLPHIELVPITSIGNPGVRVTLAAGPNLHIVLDAEPRPPQDAPEHAWENLTMVTVVSINTVRGERKDYGGKRE